MRPSTRFVTDETALGVGLAGILAHAHGRVEHRPRCQQRQSALADIGFVLGLVAGEIHEFMMHIEICIVKMIGLRLVALFLGRQVTKIVIPCRTGARADSGKAAWALTAPLPESR